MKKNIMLLFIILLAVMFLSTPVMAKSKKSDKKPWYSYFVMKAKIKSLERKLRYKIGEIKKLEHNALKLSSQKQGPPGPQGPQGLVGPMGPQGLEGKTVFSDSSTTAEYAGDVPPIVCPGCVFPKGDLPDNIDIETMLRGAYLPGSALFGTILIGADLSGIDARGATIESAYLSETNLSGAKLGFVSTDRGPYGVYYGVQTNRTRILNTDLTNVNLTGADLTGADLTGSYGLETIIWDNTTCPDGSNSNDPGDDAETCLDNLDPLAGP